MYVLAALHLVFLAFCFCFVVGAFSGVGRLLSILMLSLPLYDESL